MPKRAFALLFCAVLFVTTGFAASKKSERHRNWSEDQSELSLQNSDLPDGGSSVPGGVGNLKLSQGGGDPGGPLNLPPGVPDNWNGGTGNWSNGADWSVGVPGASSDVTIYSGGNDKVTLDVSTTISSLTLGGAANGTTSELTDGGVAQTLTITNALNVGATGQPFFSGGSTITAGASSNSGVISLFNSTLSITAGGFTNSGGVFLDNGTTLSVTGDLSNSGVISTGAIGGDNLVNITGTLNNNGSGFLEIEGHGDVANIGGDLNNSISAAVTLDDGSTLNVAGNFNTSGEVSTRTAGNIINLAGTMTNLAGGFIDVEFGGALTINGNVTNDSSGVDLGIITGFMGTGGNTLTITGTLTNNGNFELLGAGDQANISGNTTNSGDFFVAGMGSKATLGGLTNSGDVEVGNGSTLQVNGDVTNSLVIETGALVSGGGNTVNITGTLTNEGPEGFGLFGAGDTATIGGDLINSAIVTVENGSSLTVDGNVTNSGILATDFFGGGGGNSLTIIGTVTNSGTLELLGSGDFATLGGLTNSMGGVVDLENGSTLLVNGNVDNAWEMFTSSLGGSGFNTIAIDGTLTNESTGQIILFGSHDVAELLSLNNAGLVDLEGGPDSGMLVFGDVNNSGSILTSFITGSGGNTLAIVGNLNNSGGVGLFGPGDLAEIGGNLTNATGAMIDVENGSTLIVDGNASNDGTIATNFSGLGGGNTITVDGMLTNTANGLISLNGPGDVLSALAGMTNSGVINVNNGSSILPPFFNNLGTLNIDGTSRFVVGTPTPMGGQGYIQLANGTLGEMIASLMSFGVINVNGSALLDGTLAILLQGGFNPSVGSTFKFLNFTPGDLTGTFANIENDIFNGGTEKWVVDYDNADGFVELIAEPNQVPEPATLLVLVPGLLGMGYGLRRKLLR